MALRAGEAFVDIVPRLGKSFDSDLERGVTSPVEGVGKKAGGILGSTLGKAAAAAGGLFAAKVGVDFFRGAIDGASDLNETLSKSRTIFGSAAGDIEKWASRADAALGQSKQQALDSAATYGNLFSQLGIGSDSAARMSKQMVELASDFASFHNADVSDVLDAQAAAFRGEYDAVQRFVPTINAAAVEQKALALGLAGSTKELDAQDKAVATQALLMEGAGAAVGDFARTSDGLANKQRILAARMENLKAKIGNALLPVMNALTGLVSDRLLPAFDRVGAFIGQSVVPVLRRLGEAFSVLMGDDGPQGFAEIMDNLLGNSGRYVELFRSIGEAIRTVVDFVRDHLKPILIGLGAALVALTSPLVAVAAAFVLAYTKSETFRDAVNAVVRFLVEEVIPRVSAFASFVATTIGDLVAFVVKTWPQIAEAVRHVLNVIEALVRPWIASLQALWRAWGDDLLHIAETIFGYIRSTIENALNVVKGIISTVLAIINGDWGKAWDGIKQAFGGVWDQLVNIVRTSIDLVKGILGGVLSTIGEVWQGAWDKIAGAIAGAWETIKSTVRGGIDAVLGFFEGIGGRIAGLTRGMWDGIKDAFRAAVNFIIRGWNRLEFKVPGFKVGPVSFGGFTLGLPDIKELQSGGLLRGLGVVGEVGPELIATGSTARVHSNRALAEILRDAVGDVAGEQHTHFHLTLNTEQNDRDVIEDFRRMELLGAYG